MAVVVVGGHSRNIGKTSVMAGLLGATQNRGWTAVKITQYGHGICSADGKPCDCATDNHTMAITEEMKTTSGKDTSRYLAAGARRSFWVRVRQGQLLEAVPWLRALLASQDNVMLESNSVLQFVRPDVYVSLLDGEVEDFKTSARRFLDRADLVLRRADCAEGTSWSAAMPALLRRAEVIPFVPPNYLPERAVEVFQSRLEVLCKAELPEGSLHTI